MTKEDKLVIGYFGIERERVVTHLKRLLPYLRPQGFTIVGGLAIRYHLISHGVSYPKRPFNDLDIIAKDPDVVSRSVSRDFLVYHYHPKDNYLALADPISKTKVDIFCRKPSETVQVGFDGHVVNIVSLEGQLVQTIIDTLKITKNLKVDPKQFNDAKLMFKIANIDRAGHIWKEQAPRDFPTDFLRAYGLANSTAQQKPHLLVEKPFRKLRPYNCPECKNTDGFEVVPMKEVYEVLGYIE